MWMGFWIRCLAGSSDQAEADISFLSLPVEEQVAVLKGIRFLSDNVLCLPKGYNISITYMSISRTRNVGGTFYRSPYWFWFNQRLAAPQTMPTP